MFGRCCMHSYVDFWYIVCESTCKGLNNLVFGKDRIRFFCKASCNTQKLFCEATVINRWTREVSTVITSSVFSCLYFSPLLLWHIFLLPDVSSLLSIIILRFEMVYNGYVWKHTEFGIMNNIGLWTGDVLSLNHQVHHWTIKYAHLVHNFEAICTSHSVLAVITSTPHVALSEVVVVHLEYMHGVVFVHLENAAFIIVCLENVLGGEIIGVGLIWCGFDHQQIDYARLFLQ